MSAGAWRLRQARVEDLPQLPRVEASADQAFRSVGMAALADGMPSAESIARSAVQDGRVVVALAGNDRVAGAERVVGFARVETVDGLPHLEQLSVAADWARRGIGSALLVAATVIGARVGADRMTLMTFAQVPWNGPFYARRGWVVLPESEWGPGLLALREAEVESGLHRWPRQAMTVRLEPR